MSGLSKKELDAINLISNLYVLYRGREFNFDDIKAISKLDHQSARDAVEVLFQLRYIQEIFKTDLGLITRGESKIETTYRITPQGEAFAEKSMRRMAAKNELERRYQEDQEEEARIKKSNKMWSIFCVVSFIIILIIVITVALGLG